MDITILASVEETGAPFISCYLNLEDGRDSWQEAINNRARLLRLILKGDDLNDLEYALDKIESCLENELLPETNGVAIFVRGIFGGAFMLPMQFSAPLPNWITVYPTPNIYHLMELKDNYHRYVVLLAMPGWARIMEVNLGAVTKAIWLEKPESRERVATEWTRSHYQVNQTHRGNRFIQEKITVLKQLMNAEGHTHLILAGHPEITKRIRHALPENLLNKLVDVIPAAERDSHHDIVMATLSNFIEHEELESQTIAERLIEGLSSQNLAVVGAADTLDVLRWGKVDTLVMASSYRPNLGWVCNACRDTGIEPPETAVCPTCGKHTVRPMDVREEMLRLAGRLECQVEVVDQSDVLMSLGGVGCLMRSTFDPILDKTR